MLVFYLSMLDTEENKIEFEQLYKEYKQDMYSIAYGILNNREDAEDAVHISFLKIVKNFTKISSLPCQKLRAFIVIICENTAKNMYNSNKRRAEQTISLNDQTIIVNGDFEENDLLELTDAITQLPQKYKDVIYMYYLHGFSVKEIAKLLDTSTENIYQRLFRAKIMLKKLLDRSDVHE